ncbi:MAG: glycosyltransferase family protein [Hyphomicrobiales bacterium]|nr:glycosyltransferase family protein [Hyphomicrobiales bacterium]
MQEAMLAKFEEAIASHSPMAAGTAKSANESPQSRFRGNRKRPEPTNTAEALVKPNHPAALRMNTTPSLASEPVAPVMPCVPVPLDELLKIASEFIEGGRLPEADKMLDHIISAVPDSPLALHQKGVVLFRKGEHEAAADMVERAIKVLPEAIGFRRSLCPIYERLGRYDEALQVGREALEVDGDDLQTLHNLAVVHYRRLELDESIACARRALVLDPKAAGPHFQLAEALLLKGEFAQGWEEYEWRFKIPGAPPLMPATERPQWDGAPLREGTLLLIADQGFGDAIQFCRYIPSVLERCSKVVVVADPLLHPLIRQVHGQVQLVDRWQACPEFNVFSPLSSLPRVFGTRLDTIPRKASYLHATPSRAAAWKARLDDLVPSGYRRVGIAWAGRSTHNNDLNRSMKLSEFGPIAALDGVTLISLQKGAGQTAIADYYGRAPLLNLGAEADDFLDTMSIIDTLDVVVTVDTAIAHLTAAMGKTVWILLPFAPDWRWLLERSDNPWYPSARLFRQRSPGDWKSVMQSVAKELSMLGPRT